MKTYSSVPDLMVGEGINPAVQDRVNMLLKLDRIVALTHEFNKRPRVTKARQKEIISECDALRIAASKLGATPQELQLANEGNDNFDTVTPVSKARSALAKVKGGV